MLTAQSIRASFSYQRKVNAEYEPFQKRMDALMLLAGYAEGVNWVTRKFEGEEHSERSWSKRVDIPFVFFLRK
ncbi:MAG: hypothetical protein QOE46_1315 [Acidobacteriota bacterium]|jgi:hypothetical protein|nr:hypothetical protein [Acidobacteriota bacterium]